MTSIGKKYQLLFKVDICLRHAMSIIDESIHMYEGFYKKMEVWVGESRFDKYVEHFTGHFLVLK